METKVFQLHPFTGAKNLFHRDFLLDIHPRGYVAGFDGAFYCFVNYAAGDISVRSNELALIKYSNGKWDTILDYDFWSNFLQDYDDYPDLMETGIDIQVDTEGNIFFAPCHGPFRVFKVLDGDYVEYISDSPTCAVQLPPSVVSENYGEAAFSVNPDGSMDFFTPNYLVEIDRDGKTTVSQLPEASRSTPRHFVVRSAHGKFYSLNADALMCISGDKVSTYPAGYDAGQSGPALAALPDGGIIYHRLKIAADGHNYIPMLLDRYGKPSKIVFQNASYFDAPLVEGNVNPFMWRDHLIVLDFSNNAIYRAVPQCELDLARTLRKYGELNLVFNSTTINMVKEFVELRCPGLLTRAPSHPAIDIATAEAFCTFLLSDQIDPAWSAEAILGTAYLLSEYKMEYASAKCLQHLQQALCTSDELVQMYSKCLKFRPFENGIAVCQYLMKKYKAFIDKKTLIKALYDDPDQVAAVIDLLVDNSALEPPLKDDAYAAPKKSKSSKKTKVTPRSLEETLRELYRTRKGADFVIQIRGMPHVAIRCHSYVLYCRWEYFRQMMDSGMREVAEKTLTLPGEDEEGFLPLAAVEAIVELCYKHENEAERRDTIDASVAMSILGTKNLYLASQGSSNAFDWLLGFSEHIVSSALNDGNCIDLFLAASRFHADEIAKSAKEVIIDLINSEENLDDDFVTKIQQLPYHLQVGLLWHLLGRPDEEPPMNEPAHPAATPQNNDDDVQDGPPPAKRRKTSAPGKKGK